jgi:site-specific recombinase XerD
MSVERSHRPDGSTRYKVRWRQGGRSRARSFDRLQDANRFDGEIKRRIALGDDLAPRGTQRLGDYASEWWESYAEPRLAEGTLAVYATQLDLRIRPRLGELQLREIKPSVVEDFIAALVRDGDRGPTIVKALTVLQAILQRAVRDEEIPANPVRLVRKPSQRRTREPIVIPPVQVEAMRRHLLAHGRLRDATLISVLAYAGLRPQSEAVTLMWPQVRERTLLIRASKLGGRQRTVRLLKPLADDLRDWRLASGLRASKGLVLPTEQGAWAHHDWKNWHRRVFRPTAQAAGLPDGLRPRDLRGSFATLLIHEGQTVIEVARQLGHSPQMCLNTYAGVFDEFDPADRVSAEEAIIRARARRASSARQRAAR